MRHIIILLGFIAFYSCKNEKIPPTFDTIAYPIQVGNQWDYRVTDLWNGKVDTVVLTVASQTRQQNTITYNNRLEKQGVLIDSSHFMLSDRFLRYEGWRGQHSFLGTFELHTPFGKEAKWNAYITTADKYIVSDYVYGYQVLGKKYDVYVLERNFSAGNVDLQHTLYVSNKIGLVSQQFDFYDGGDRYKKKFELINYQLK